MEALLNGIHIEKIMHMIHLVHNAKCTYYKMYKMQNVHDGLFTKQMM